MVQQRPKLGPISVIRANPWNAVICAGHVNGRVTMWTPNLGTAVVSMQCHLGAVGAIAVDSTGRYMATAGLDSKVHIWDLRNSYHQLHTYPQYPNVCSLDVSRQGFLSIGFNSMVCPLSMLTSSWQKLLCALNVKLECGCVLPHPFGPFLDRSALQIHTRKNALATHNKKVYLEHRIEGGGVACNRFCPYQDVLAVGHASGMSTMIVPGAGEPNYDSFIANPYQDAKQRQEGEVHQLMDKLQPDTIVLDPVEIGKVRLVYDLLTL